MATTTVVDAAAVSTGRWACSSSLVRELAAQKVQRADAEFATHHQLVPERRHA